MSYQEAHTEMDLQWEGIAVLAMLTSDEFESAKYLDGGCTIEVMIILELS